MGVELIAFVYCMSANQGNEINYTWIYIYLLNTSMFFKKVYMLMHHKIDELNDFMYRKTSFKKLIGERQPFLTHIPVDHRFALAAVLKFGQ